MLRERIFPLCIGWLGSLALGEFDLWSIKPSVLEIDIEDWDWIELTMGRENAKLLTKGDNNPSDDVSLYAKGQDFIERKDIIGSVVAYIPFVGYVTILLSEHPWLKTVMLGIMGLVVVLQRE
jgi:hypothetical protein